MYKLMVFVSVFLFSCLNSWSEDTAGETPYRKLKEHFGEYLKKAKAGDAEAQGIVAEACRSRLFGRPDFKGAFMWSEKAAKKNDPLGQFVLGYLYYCNTKGFGITQDRKKSKELFLKSKPGLKKLADSGDVLALFVCSMSFVTENSEDRKKYLEAAAEKGHPFAQYMLGMQYLDGSEGREKDIPKAIEYLKKSADENFEMAAFDLARIYKKGIGVKKDPKLADSIMKKFYENQGLKTIKAPPAKIIKNIHKKNDTGKDIVK